jgi:NitT/TauT family transport system substrate-binding protein
MSKTVQHILVALVLIFGANSACLAETAKKLQPITIAQFGHVFLYMPLYVAVDKGFFKEQGLDVKLTSTGGDEKTFTAVLSGNAQFGVSDPVFAAIARERGQGGKVVASIVRGVPFWVVTFDNKLKAFDNASGFAGHRIATYTAPSTSYAVMKGILANNGHPVDAKIVQGAFGTLLAMLKTSQADMALDIEPIVSIATNQGAHIIYSPASKLGDFAFTGLTVSDAFHAKHPDQIQEAVIALAKSMKFIEHDFDGTLTVAKKEFPEVPEPALREALKRLIKEGTIPKSPVMTKTAWDRSVALRKEIGDMKGGDARSGDIKSSNSFEQNVDMKFAAKAAHDSEN